MRIIDDYFSTNPYFNLAAEEYFLNHTKEDICRFWQNENAVVIGKHQALAAEVNTQTAHEKEITIARRISGGGTVYHDLGNLNFTFIKNNGESGNMIDFKQFTQPIIDALKSLNLNIEHSGRNDLLLNGFKISGNAEHLSQKLNRTLHHGTLLFNSNLQNLGNVLKTPIEQFEGKFVHSKRSAVCNIIDYLTKPISLLAFRNVLCNYFQTLGYLPSSLTTEKIKAINAIADEKYSTKDWILGYSPKYKFQTKLNSNPLYLDIQNGKIVHLETNDALASELKKILIGVYHEYTAIKQSINKSALTTIEKQLVLDSCFFK